MSKLHAIKEFLSLQEIALFVAVVCIVLALFFPRREIISIILKNPGYVSPEFIKAVIKVDPAEGLKIALIRNYIKAGRYGKARKALKNFNLTMNNINFFDYVELKFKLLRVDYYTAPNASAKDAVKNRISTLLSMLSLSGASGFNKYIKDNGRERVRWLFEAYKFESELGNYKLALGLLGEYLTAYPEYKEKYFVKTAVLCVLAGENMKAYRMLLYYIKTRKNYGDKVKLFEVIAERSILERNYYLTRLLIGIYKEDFPRDLKIEKFILTYVLQSGDPYFARSIAIELSRRKA